MTPEMLLYVPVLRLIRLALEKLLERIPGGWYLPRPFSMWELDTVGRVALTWPLSPVSCPPIAALRRRYEADGRRC